MTENDLNQIRDVFKEELDFVRKEFKVNLDEAVDTVMSGMEKVHFLISLIELMTLMKR